VQARCRARCQRSCGGSKPYTLNPKPYTHAQNPQTFNPNYWPQTLNPNPVSYTLSLKPYIPDPKPP